MMIRLAAAKNTLSSKRTKITNDVEKFKKVRNEFNYFIHTKKQFVTKKKMVL